jgi:hypothetical protein
MRKTIPRRPKRVAKETKSFKVPGTFESLYAAEKWCKDNGYSYGSLCAGMPTALFKGDCIISKWYNLSRSQQNTCDGVILSSDFREGEVTVVIYN